MGGSGGMGGMMQGGGMAGMGGGMGGMLAGMGGMSMGGMGGGMGCGGQSSAPPGAPGAPAEYANVRMGGLKPGQSMADYDTELLKAAGNPNAEAPNPMDAGSLMPNGTHTMFQSQSSSSLLRIRSNGDVDFTGRLMDHQETMLRVLRAPDGKHYRIGSVNFPELWLQILPDGTIDGRGTIDSPYGTSTCSRQ
jgi:hypothetical protein